MRQSKLFTKTRREAPKDELSKNAQLLIRAGYVHKEMAGVYSYLPLGWRVVEKINQIIRREMDALGATEVHLSALQNPESWQLSGRWSDPKVDFWFKTLLRNQTEVGLGATHEEPLTFLLKEHLKSYRDLPCYLYQIQTKFRNEARVKSGLLRQREFVMKDLYSFHQDNGDLDNFYERVKESYLKILETLGLGDRTFVTFASGGAFSRFSHEFQTISEVGEDTIYLDEEKKLAVNLEVSQDEVLAELGLEKDKLVAHQAIEVGNIFKLGTRFSDAIGLHYLTADGEKKPVVMGSYGLGPSRLLGAVAEVWADKAGLIWPEAITPFRFHLVSLDGGDEALQKTASELYTKLRQANIEVLYDDRPVSAGEKFADSDLLGIPFRIVVSSKTNQGGRLEMKERKSGEISMVSEGELLKNV